jgi:hypothetical protein
VSYIDALDQLKTAGDELGYDDGWAEALLSRHAHELAQQIRETSRTNYRRVSAVYGHDYARGWASGRQRGADLIDPEVAKP